MSIKFSKVFIILLFPFCIHFLLSCCDCKNKILESKKYTNTQIEITNFNNKGIKPDFTKVDTIQKETYGFRFNLKREVVVKNHNNSIFINSAYAYTCKCKEEIEINPKDKINTIKIYNIFDFDANTIANSDITNKFKIYENKKYTNVNEYFTDSQTLFYDYGMSTTEIMKELDFLLMEAPSTSQIQQFKIKLFLSDGRILESQTNPLFLN